MVVRRSAKRKLTSAESDARYKARGAAKVIRYNPGLSTVFYRWFM